MADVIFEKYRDVTRKQRIGPVHSTVYCSVFYLQMFQVCQIGKHSDM